ncbi:MAG: DUF4296 domain-containing protein [Odoribacteraceae bacterium]|jgi:hypothetical protein|nr:DUF4296 domain-containing protein [Odoribacteraceae bacterium]
MNLARSRHPLVIAAILAAILSCARVPLGEKRFIALLVDLHTADAILADGRVAPAGDREKRAYYDGLFAKHGITRDDFDTLARYYAAPGRHERVYSAVTRELERRDTANLVTWAALTREDTVNLLPPLVIHARDTIAETFVRAGLVIVDTLHAVVTRERLVIADTLPLDDLNTSYSVDIDASRPGNYKARLRVYLDTARVASRVTAYFYSPGGDTLRAREIVVRPDRRPRDYTWSHYLPDSTGFTRLHVDILLPDSVDAGRRGWIAAPRLYREYLPPKEARRVTEQQRSWQRQRAR